MSSSSTSPYRTDLTTTAPTPGFRSAGISTGSQGPRDVPSTRQGRGGGRRGTQGCEYRIAHPNPPVSSQRPFSEVRPPFASTSGRTGILGTSLEVDRSSCRGRPGAHHPKRVGTYLPYGSYWRCTCPDAREASRIYYKRLREGRKHPGVTDSIGSARRLRALTCIGWTLAELARRLGVDESRVWQMRKQNRPVLFLGSHNAVCALYRDLWDT